MLTPVEVMKKPHHGYTVTVNSEIFVRVLYLRNFAYAKFRENKILKKWRNYCRLLI